MDNSGKITIIDYGRGNLLSIEKAVKKSGGCTITSNDPEKICSAEKLILPGVGAFGDAMGELKTSNLADALLEFVKTGRPLLGICLGMQLLFTESEEFGCHQGLDLIKGNVKRFQKPDKESYNYKIPHIGWTRIKCPELKSIGTGCKAPWDKSILRGIESGSYFYFVHSYICIPSDKNNILAESSFGKDRFCSVVNRNNIWGCQFHPEKSGKDGLEIFKNFIKNNI